MAKGSRPRSHRQAAAWSPSPPHPHGKEKQPHMGRANAAAARWAGRGELEPALGRAGGREEVGGTRGGQRGGHHRRHRADEACGEVGSATSQSAPGGCPFQQAAGSQTDRLGAGQASLRSLACGSGRFQFSVFLHLDCCLALILPHGPCCGVGNPPSRQTGFHTNGNTVASAGPAAHRPAK